MLKELKTRITVFWFKLILSIIAICFIVFRFIWPELKIDAITIGFFVVAALPWLSEILESAKFPGGWEIRFRDIQKAGARITTSSSFRSRASLSSSSSSSLSSSSSESSSSLSSSESQDISQPSYLTVAEHDSNLALVGLRIEIEKRLRELARRYNLPERKPLSQTLRNLRSKEILDHNSIEGLQELVYAGNHAAHGAKVEAGVAEWAINYGPDILSILDQKLIQT